MASTSPPTYEAAENERRALNDDDEEEPPPFETLTTENSQVKTNSQLGRDGRVDISISKVDKRLLQRLEREQADEAHQQAAEAAAGFSLAEPAAAATGIPSLNIVIQVVGSRGDVQPFVALGLVLKNKYHHRIRLATHGTFKKFVEENGLEFFDIGGDPAELMAFMVKNPKLLPTWQSIREGDIGKRKKGMAEIMRGCWKSCADSSEIENEESEGDQASHSTKPKPFVAHAIIANPPSFAHIHCAEKLGVPVHLMFTMPWSPTSDFPQPIANIRSSDASGPVSNKLSYTIVEMMTWEGLGTVTNKFREESLKLPELSQAAATTAIHRLRIPYTYCWSPALIPKPKDWGPHIDIAGFYFLPLGAKYQPEPDLAEFLAAGPPPVYIGFGSIVVDDPNAMTKLIFSAVEKTGQRALVSKGWGGLGGDELGKPSNIIMLGNCPHDWLFKHVSAVVHHGGAGTTAAGIALGRPTVIVPFFGDQPFWGAMVARTGAGPNPIPYKDLTAENLAEAILQAIKPSTLERAQELGARIQNESGAETGAESFHAHLNLSRLRCDLSPSRVAVWQTKPKGLKSSETPHHHHLRLSAFAATLLSEAGLLDMNTLQLSRYRDYELEDPSGYASMSDANPLLSTAGSVANRILHLPINHAKAWGGLVYEPYKGARSGEGWKGFGKGVQKGLGDWLFPRRGMYGHGGYRFGVRAVYETMKKRFGDQGLGFVAATWFVEGWEEVRGASEGEKGEVMRAWEGVSEEVKAVALGADGGGKKKGRRRSSGGEAGRSDEAGSGVRRSDSVQTKSTTTTTTTAATQPQSDTATEQVVR